MSKLHVAKKYIVVSALSLGFAILVASTSQAVFTGGTRITNSASVALTGTGVVTLSVTPKNLTNNGVATAVAWSGVTLPVAGGWKNADQYLQLDTVITAGNGGVRIITSNKSAGASPTYTGSNSTAGGLVDNTDTTKALQLAWTIKDVVDVAAVGASTGPVSAKPYETTDGTGQTAQFQWLFMTDEVDASVAQGAPYRTAVNSSGIHFGGSDTEFGLAASPNYVYLEAEFATAVTPRTYSTNHLIVEAYTQ